MNISPIESKMVEFIRRPENMEKIQKLNNKNEKSKLEEAPKQNRLEDKKSSSEIAKQEEALFNMVKEVLNELDANNIDVNVGFTFRDDFDNPIIEVIDKDSKKVIRQIPTEDFISRINNLEDLKGMLFDDKVWENIFW